MKRLIYISFVLVSSYSINVGAQFVVNGNASITTPECPDSSTTYLLTPNQNNQGGQIWYPTQVSLIHPFDIQFQMFLGNKTYSVGADGVCFVFQQLSVNAGSLGGGLGYAGITPSIAVEFDTYQNGWDPAYCHTAIEKNGDVDHTDLSGNNLAGPVQLDPGNPNLPDGAWHNMEVIWNPDSQTIKVYYDCNMRVSYKGDIIDSIFAGNPNVYWGFTAGTGGSDNKQEVCIAHSYLNNLRDTAVCAGGSVSLSVSGGVSYVWSPDKWLNADTNASIIATPDSTTTYTVSITNTCGFISKDSVTIAINPIPSISLTTKDTICLGSSITLSAATNVGTPSYAWSNGATTSSINIMPGTTQTFTVSVSDDGCTKDTSFTVNVKNPPVITLTPSQKICLGKSVTLDATGGGLYKWSNGATTSSITFSPDSSNNYEVVVSNGCLDSTSTFVTVNVPVLNACCDTTITKGGSAPITAIGNGSYVWLPNDGSLNCYTCTSVIASPTVTTTYTIVSIDSNGCPISRTVTVDVFVPCADFSVPNIFTPNNDGINDDFVVNVLNPTSYSIEVFDRWGKEVYSSTDPTVYWTGRINNTQYLVNDGIYYYIIKANCGSNNYLKKGFVQVLGEQ